MLVSGFVQTIKHLIDGLDFAYSITLIEESIDLTYVLYFCSLISSLGKRLVDNRWNAKMVHKLLWMILNQKTSCSECSTIPVDDHLQTNGSCTVRLDGSLLKIILLVRTRYPDIVTCLIYVFLVFDSEPMLEI